MSKKPNKTTSYRKFYLGLGIFTASILIFIVLFIGGFWLIFNDKIFPGIYIANVYVGGLTPLQAEEAVNIELSHRSKPINLISQNNNLTLNLEDSYTTNLKNLTQQAYQLGRRQFFFSPQKLNLNITFNPNYYNQIAPLENSTYQAPLESQIRFENGDISVTPSETGQGLDNSKLQETISNYLNSGVLSSSQLPLRTLQPKLSYQAALSIKQTLDTIKLYPLKLAYQDQLYTIDIDTLLKLIDLQNSSSILISMTPTGTGTSQAPTGVWEIKSLNIEGKSFSDAKLKLDPIRLNEFLSKIAANIDRPVQEPLFQFDGSRVTEFKAPVTGRSLDQAQTAKLITNALATIPSTNQSTINLPVNETLPKNKLSNDLGIKELIGSGVSHFSGSIPNRIYNVGLAASRLNGILIAPGETFSFVNKVGDISASSGYKQAYVIKSGRTVLDDGGGVCQVSTTLFRTVLNSGLPINERSAHAYRVGYYEQGFPPGLDATIFSPTVDFKFTNDTAHHILVQTRVAGTTLTVDFYGTKDGRSVTVSKPVILSQTPPLPEIRQDDPTLPRGTVKQVDWAAWGAKVRFTRSVTKNGQTQTETFNSNYRPWQAVYLVGTKDG